MPCNIRFVYVLRDTHCLPVQALAFVSAVEQIDRSFFVEQFSPKRRPFFEAAAVDHSRGNLIIRSIHLILLSILRQHFYLLC